MEQDLTDQTEQVSEQEIASSRFKTEKSEDEYKVVKRIRYSNSSNGLIALPDSDSDLDSNPNGYIVLCRKCSYYTELNSDPYSIFLHGTGI